MYSKITPELRKEIAEKFATKEYTIGMLAREYHMPQATIWCIIHGYRISKGRRCSPSMSPKTKKLNARIVQEIRQRLSDGESDYYIAKWYSIHPDSVKNIRDKITWVWVPEPDGGRFVLNELPHESPAERRKRELREKVKERYGNGDDNND